MCDYSLKHVKSRAANVGDKLITRNFGTGTRGFAGLDDPTTAVCLLPGTEIGFDAPISIHGGGKEGTGSVGIFRQINKDQPFMHHDALEIPNGDKILLTFLSEGQTCTVLQLPAKPKTDAEREEQRRAEVVG